MHHPRMIVVLPIVFFVIAIYVLSWWIKLAYSNKVFVLEEVTINEYFILGMIIFLVLGFLLAYAHNCSLKTKISSKGICLSYPPFHKKWKKIDVAHIKSYEVRKYNHLREYYGHGKRDNRIRGQAYTISGNIGLQLYFKDGKRLLIGTQNKQAIEYAMKKLMEIK